MLELRDISLNLRTDHRPNLLLQQVSARWPSGHLGAIVGPSGCGKSTLLKVIAGLTEHTQGSVHWEGRDLSIEGDLLPSELGYVPQFSIAPERLTTWECVRYALWLRVKALNARQRRDQAASVLEQVGLGERLDTQTRFLSGGQRRRLALALELVTNPTLMLCDEVTSGLDPNSENDIVELLYHLARTENRLVLTVTHSLKHLNLYDSVTVLNQGFLLYSGPGVPLLPYFEATTAEELFPALTRQETLVWVERWAAKKSACELISPIVEPESAVDSEAAPESHPRKHSGHDPLLPGWMTQLTALTARRWRLFLREGGQIALQISLLFVFPGLVVLFALDGLPQIKNLNLSSDGNIVQQLRETLDFTVQTSHVGGLVSGLVMFQVILLTLMGSNNGAREIIAERPIYEKEKLSGLRPAAYLASKMAFLVFFVTAQAAIMTTMVKFVCQFPGPLEIQFLILFLVNAAMTATCLAISAWSRTSEQASLSSVYLVGFQLPLSGAVLALPAAMSFLTQPLIISYWSWSGMLQTMRDTRFYDLVQTMSETAIASLPMALFVLSMHLLIALVIALAGCIRSQWD